MLTCHTLIINNSGELESNGLKIGGLELKVKTDGSLTTTDIDGNEQIINNKFKHVEINITNTKQTISPKQETQIYFDEDFLIEENENFENGTRKNSIKIIYDGHYFISFNLSLDMYNGKKTTVQAYIKINNKINNKSISYTYYNSSKQGFGSITNSFIYESIEKEEISLYSKVKEGSGQFYTVPLATNFNIFKI